MMKTVNYAPVLVFFAILFVLDLYSYKGLKILVQNIDNEWLRKGILIGHWAVFAGIFVWLLIATFNSPWMSNYKHYKYYYYLFGIILLFYIPKIIFSFFVFSDDLLMAGKVIASWFQHSGSASPKGEQISRSQFIYQVGFTVATIPFIGAAYGMLKGRFDFRTVKIEKHFENLPPAFDGLRIVQISDAHLGSFFDDKTHVRKGFKMIRDLKPDLIVFTGDMVNNYSIEAENWIEEFKSLTAPFGKFAIVGNHDYGDYSSWPDMERKKANFDRLLEIQKEMGFKPLLNEHILLEQQGEKIALIGVENWGIKPFPQKGDIDKAKKGTENIGFKILLSHDPTHWDIIVSKEHPDINLTFSGHTHGAQFGVELGNVKWSPIQYKYKHWGGLYEKAGQVLYVNRGFGYIGFPGRVGIPPEITLITLRAGVNA